MLLRGTDLHSHILPKTDHGCDSAAQAAEQLSMMKHAGIDTAVATPHFYPAAHDFSSFAKRVEEALSQVTSLPLSERPRLLVGAEVLICAGLHRLPELDRLCIRGTRVLLLELPFSGCTDEHFEEVEDLLHGGYTVVLAHIDRYVKKFGDHIDTLLSMGALAQINAASLQGFFDRRRLMPYLQSGCVVGFGTDLHGTDREAIAAYEALGRLPDDLFSRITAKSNALLEGAQGY